MKKLVIRLFKAQTIMLLLILLMLVGNGLAYLAARDEKVNHFVIGVNKCEIVEEWDAPVALEGGEVYYKKISVRNEGSLPCYTRLWAEITDADLREVIDVREEGEWEKSSDGWWYYSKRINAGDLSEELIFAFTPRETVSENFEMPVCVETVEARNCDNAEEAFSEIIP